jgi:hypothetical protein
MPILPCRAPAWEGAPRFPAPRQRERKDKRFRSRGKRERMRNNERHERLASQQEGRRSAEKRTNQEPHRRMRRTPFLLSSHCGKTEVAGDLKKWSGRARLSAPHRGIRGFEPSARLRPRFLESPDANGRTLSGTSAASTSRSDTRRTGRCPSRPRAQCMAALDENRSRSALRSTLAKGVPLRAGFWLGNFNGDESQELVSVLRMLERITASHPPHYVVFRGN